MPTTLKDFESVFPKLVEDISAQCKQYNLPANALEWYEKVILPAPMPVLIHPSDETCSHSSTIPSVGNVTAASPFRTQRPSSSQTLA